jgi:hypothetical protein
MQTGSRPLTLSGGPQPLPYLCCLPPLVDGEERFEVRTRTDRFVGGLLNPWLNHLLPATLLRWIVDWSSSPILRETFRCPGGWTSTYLAYQKAPAVDWIDWLVLNDPIARSLRNRRQVVTRLLSEFLIRYAGQGPVTMLGVGAGPGMQFQDAILRTGLPVEHISAHIVDLHDDAFPYGQARARELGLHSAMHYVRGDARQIEAVLPNVRAQIVKLIGLIEYLEDAEVLKLLGAVRRAMTDDGVLLTNSFVDRYRCAPFLTRVLGLRHVWRTSDHMSDLLHRSGFAAPEHFETPMRMYTLLWAHRAS